MCDITLYWIFWKYVNEAIRFHSISASLLKTNMQSDSGNIVPLFDNKKKMKKILNFYLANLSNKPRPNNCARVDFKYHVTDNSI